MNNLISMLSVVGTTTGSEWDDLTSVLSELFPILWLATAIVSTIWMVVRFVQSNFQTATGNQAKYQAAKKARTRALFAWLVGCLWPVIFIAAWIIAQQIYGALNPDGDPLPDLFQFGGDSSGLVPDFITNLKIAFKN